LEVRFKEVRLKPPQRRRKLGELKIWAILAEEINAPEGVEPLKWMLLTTVVLESFNDATEKLLWYTRRWGIEVYHRTLKSGCKIEERQSGSADCPGTEGTGVSGVGASHGAIGRCDADC
jgi:hypothetical protein